MRFALDSRRFHTGQCNIWIMEGAKSSWKHMMQKPHHSPTTQDLGSWTYSWEGEPAWDYHTDFWTKSQTAACSATCSLQWTDVWVSKEELGADKAVPGMCSTSRDLRSHSSALVRRAWNSSHQSSWHSTEGQKWGGSNFNAQIWMAEHQPVRLKKPQTPATLLEQCSDYCISSWRCHRWYGYFVVVVSIALVLFLVVLLSFNFRRGHLDIFLLS